jgi:hypothetical protein
LTARPLAVSKTHRRGARDRRNGPIMTSDLAGHIGDIARRLLGEPNKTLSTKTELRFGSKGSVSVEIAGPNRGQWYDHENQIGGGAWKLLTVKSGKSNGEAIDWLASELGIKVDPETDRHNGKIVATYDYRDESGRLLFQVVRLEPKDFRQRCPDGAGGWIWKTRGVRKVLYRLPELLAAPADEKVFIVEGEKDVNRLVELRFIATCNPGGVAKNRAGERPGRSKWLPGFNPPLSSRHVVIIPDNDEARAAHAEVIAHELVSIASSVRRISLPGLLPKGDVSDWLDAGGTREELERLAAAAQPYKTPTAKTAAQDDALEDNAKIAELAKLAPLAWARRRKSAAQELGCPVGLLDKVVAFERAKSQIGNAAQGRPLELLDIEPWPNWIDDGAGLLDELTAAIRRYVILDLVAARGVALWVVFTHVFAVASFAPKLLISSPFKRSGKTRMIRVLSYLVPRPLSTSNATASTLFRVIEEHCPTLLIDEADTFMRDDEELRGLINSGFDREQARILRNVPIGDQWETREFSTWCPQAIAGIGNLPETIDDRGFRITLKRKLKTEQVMRLRARDAGPLKELARKIARFAADHRVGLEDADPELPAALNDRASDAWQLCVAIADLAGGNWPTWAREAALALSGDEFDDEGNHTIMLLSDIRAAFAARNSDRISSAALVDHLVSLDDRPWAEMGKAGKPITQNRLARLLKLLKDRKLRPSTIRLSDSGTAKGYLKSTFADAFAHYLPSEDPPFSTVTP